MRVVITGGVGFLGRKLAGRLLADSQLNGRGIDPLVLFDRIAGTIDSDDDRLLTIVGDLTDPDQVTGVVADADAVFHLGAIVSGEAEQALMRADGLSEERVREILWPVSPGSFAPQLPPERLGIFAGAIDTLVWPDEALRLAAHWGGISPQWFPGAHLTFAGTAAQRACLYSTFAAGGLLEKS